MWQHHHGWFRWLCGHMPWLTMEVFHCRQGWIGYVALYIHQLYIIFLLNSVLPQYGYTLIWVNVATYSCFFRICGRFWTVHPRWYFWRLNRYCRCGLNGVCIAAGSQQVAHWITHPSIGSIQIRSQLAEVHLQTWLPGVEKVRKMKTKRSGKSWGIYV